MLSKSCVVGDHCSKDCSANTTNRDGNAKEIGDKDAVKLPSKKNIIPSPNKILQSTFNGLKYEHKKKPSLFGAGVHGLMECFSSFCLFVKALKGQWSNGLGFPLPATARELDEVGGGLGGGGWSTLYFASADIKHC